MKEYIIRLTPLSNFEISLHSDTIFGAICWGIRTLFGEPMLLEILEQFDTSPPFILTSAFPWQNVNGECRYYLPRPILAPLKIEDLRQVAFYQKVQKEAYHSNKYALIRTNGDYKAFRKIKWIPLTEFRQIMKDMSEGNHYARYLDNIFAEPEFFTSGVVQKNSLDRLTNSTTGSGNTFYQMEASFHKEHGIYFLMKTKDIGSYLKPALCFLEDSGIGPNARTGRNWFSLLIEEKSLFQHNNGNTFITLSRYMANEPLVGDKCFYQLAAVRSKVESRLEFTGEDVWKERVTYFSVGSVITPQEKNNFYGRLAPVKEIAGKTIRQYGYAYPVWVNMGGDHAI